MSTHLALVRGPVVDLRAWAAAHHRPVIDPRASVSVLRRSTVTYLSDIDPDEAA